METPNNTILTAYDYDLFYNGRVIIPINDEPILERDLIAYPFQQPDLYHKLATGDTLTYLAWKYYSPITKHSSRYWKYIADANFIFNPLDLSSLIGVNLVIPNFQLIRLSE